MLENIIVGVMILIAATVGIWCWWTEKHDTTNNTVTSTETEESEQH